MKELKKILIVGIIIVLIGTTIAPCLDAKITKQDNYVNLNNNCQIQEIDNQELIDEYTWSVIKYADYMENQVNSEEIRISKPTYGPLLILSNYMSPELCKVALEVYCENEDGSLNELATLNKLVKYVNESVVHYYGIYENVSTIPTEDIFDNFNVFNTKTGKKIPAHEMGILGDHFRNGKYDFIGDCYSVSSFITAVLRLCGFSTKDVFNVGIGGKTIPVLNKFPFFLKPIRTGHVVNLICADGKWYVIDGTMWRNETGGRLYSEREKYQIGKIAFVKDFDLLNMTVINRFFVKDRIGFFENEQYFLGHSWQDDPIWKIYSNINKEDFRRIFNSAFTKGFNNARFSVNPYLFQRLFVWRISNRAMPHPYVNTISLPYTVNDAIGETIEEKAQYLAYINREFIYNHKSVNGLLNQYDKAFYAYGLINVTYPQAYAKAARLAGHTSWFGHTNDTDVPFEDVNKTVNWIRENFEVNQTVNDDQVAFSDLTFILKNGSTLDQAVFAYGAIRNMKKERCFWSPENLFVIVTNDNNGYLAVNVSDDGWIYLNFGEGTPIREHVENIRFAFNEEIKLDEWDH